MAEFPSFTSQSNPQKVIKELDMAASQQLVQLSDEDNDNNNNRNRNNNWSTDNEEVYQSQSEITSALIEQIFGKEEECRPKKQRRYRSLVSIYMKTKPVNERYGKQQGVSSYCRNPNGVLA